MANSVKVIRKTAEFSTKPIWADEFYASSIETYFEETGEYFKETWTNVFSGPSWDNNGFYWSPNQVSVSDGQLHLNIDRQTTATVLTDGTQVPAGSFLVGGVAAYELNADGKNYGFGFQYGKVEIRAKADFEVTGAGIALLLWPSLDDHWPPEIDILETPKGDGLFTNHWKDSGGTHQMEHKQFDLDYSQWHTYTLEWTPDRLALKVDGKTVYTTTSNIPHEKMSVGLMGYVGHPDQAWYGGAPPADLNHLGIHVDYVRVYDYLLL